MTPKRSGKRGAPHGGSVSRFNVLRPAMPRLASFSQHFTCKTLGRSTTLPFTGWLFG